MPKKPQKQPEDENAMISPKHDDLPDLPTLAEDTQHNLHEANSNETSDQMKKFISLTIVGLLAIGVGTAFGVSHFSKEASSVEFYLASESGLLSAINGDVMISPDNGINWQSLTADYNIHPGLQIKTDASANASMKLGDESSISIPANSHISIRSLNNIKVSIEIIKGSMTSVVSSNESWTFEVTAGNASYTAVGTSQATLGASSLVVALSSGQLQANGVDYDDSASLTLDIN